MIIDLKQKFFEKEKVYSVIYLRVDKLFLKILTIGFYVNQLHGNSFHF